MSVVIPLSPSLSSEQYLKKYVRNGGGEYNGPRDVYREAVFLVISRHHPVVVVVVVIRMIPFKNVSNGQK